MLSKAGLMALSNMGLTALSSTSVTTLSYTDSMLLSNPDSIMNLRFMLIIISTEHLCYILSLQAFTTGNSTKIRNTDFYKHIHGHTRMHTHTHARTHTHTCTYII